MQHLRRHTDAKDEAERYAAEQAARPVLSDAERATCLYHAISAAVAVGDLVKARRLAAELQPLLGALS